MNKLFKQTFFLIGLLLVGASSAAEMDAVLIQEKLAIGVNAPKGWMLDSQVAKNMGLCSVYILEGTNFNNSPALIYPRFASSDYTGEKGIEKLIEESSNRSSQASKDLKITKEKDFKNKNGLIFKIVKFMNGPRPNNFEKIAYLNFKNSILLAVYSSLNQGDFEKHESKFNEFLEKVTPYGGDLNALSGLCLYPVKK